MQGNDVSGNDIVLLNLVWEYFNKYAQIFIVEYY